MRTPRLRIHVYPAHLWLSFGLNQEFLSSAAAGPDF
jgi:hypothetical protein